MVRIYRRVVGAVLCVGISLCACSVHGATPDTPDGVPVLLYHEIVRGDKEPGETVVTLDKFAAQMQYLHDHDYTTISVAELVAYMQGGTVPERAVVLTFDDGWKSALNAVPILKQYGFKASFWIITGLGIGGDYMEWSDIAALAADPAFDVESHSVTHPWDLADNFVTWASGDIPGRSTTDVLEELTASRDTLEERLGTDVRYFAWPCGWYTDSLLTLAKSAGYAAQLTAEDGFNAQGGDVDRIRRIFVDGACDISMFPDVLRYGRYSSCQQSGRITRGHLPSQVITESSPSQ